MAVSHKVTYSLKPQIVERVAELAAHWGVPKSEVVQRAILSAVATEKLEERRSPLQALAWLQKNGISPGAAKKFKAEVRQARLDSDRSRR